jgi:hypothetical protein
MLRKDDQTTHVEGGPVQDMVRKCHQGCFQGDTDDLIV